MESPASGRRPRWGLTFPFTGLPLAEHEPLVRAAEQAGFDDLWSAEVAGPDGFTPLTLAAAWTERPRLITGVVNAFTRGPAVLAQTAAALQDASGGRFCLGIGSSSNVIVERWNQIPFERPLSRVREVIEAIRPALAGERGPGGFKLEQPPAEPVPIFVAALRERMLALAGELADGVFLNYLPLSGAGRVIETVRAAEREAGREPGTVEIACRFFCIPQPAEQALPIARWMFAAYGTVPVYERFFRWLGWGDALDPMVSAWRGGDRQRALEVAPDDLIREIFVFGDAGEMRARLDEFVRAGVETVSVMPIAPPEALGDVIPALAPSP